VEKMRAQIAKLGEAVVDLVPPTPVIAAGLVGGIASGAAASFGMVDKIKNIFQSSNREFGFGDEIVLFELEQVCFKLEIQEPESSSTPPAGRIKIGQSFSLLPAGISLRHKGKAVNISVKKVEKTDITIDFPFSPGAYQLDVNYLDLPPLTLQLNIRKK